MCRMVVTSCLHRTSSKAWPYSILPCVTQFLQQRTDAAGPVTRATTDSIPNNSCSGSQASATQQCRRCQHRRLSRCHKIAALASRARYVWTWKHAAQLTMGQRQQQQQGPPVGVAKPLLHAFWCVLRMIVPTAGSPACAALRQSPTVWDRIVSAMLAGVRYCEAPVRAHSAPLRSHDGTQPTNVASQPQPRVQGRGDCIASALRAEAIGSQLATSHTTSTCIGHCAALVAQCIRQLGVAGQKGHRQARRMAAHCDV